MKNKFFLQVLAMLTLSALVNAQPVNKPGSDLHVTLPGAAKDTFIGEPKPVQPSVIKEFGWQDETWVLASKQELTYDENDSVLVNLGTLYNETEEAETRMEFERENNFLTRVLTYFKNPESEWSLYQKLNYQYLNNQVTSVTDSMIWSPDSATFSLISQVNLEYDTDSRPVKIVNYCISLPGLEIRPVNEKLIYYGVNNNSKVIVTSYYYAGKIASKDSVLIQLDDLGLEKEQTRFDKYKNGNQFTDWVLKQKNHYYYTDGRPDSVIRELFMPETASWNKTSTTYYTYQNGNLSSVKEIRTGEYSQMLSMEFSYTENNRLNEKIFFAHYFDGSVAGKKTVYTYHTRTEIQPNEESAGFELYPAYPNPFNPETRISFQLSKSLPVLVSVIDIQGREVMKLDQGILPPGKNEVRLNASALSSGLYFYRIQAGNIAKSGKLLLQK